MVDVISLQSTPAPGHAGLDPGQTGIATLASRSVSP